MTTSDNARRATGITDLGSSPRHGEREPFRLMVHALSVVPGARGLVAGVVLASLAGAVAVVALAAGLGNLLGTLTGSGMRGAWTEWLWMTVAAAAGRGVATGAERWLAGELGFRVRVAWRSRLIQEVVARGPAGVAADEASDWAGVATAGVEAAARLAAEVLPRTLNAAILPLAIWLVLWERFWIAGAVLTVTLPLVPVFMVLVGEAAERQGRRQWETQRRLEAHFLDVVDGLATLRLFNRGRRQLERIRAMSEQYRAEALRTVRLALLSSLVLELFAAVSMALVAVAVGLALLGRHIGYGTALTVLVLTPEAFQPLRRLGAEFHQALSGLAAARALLARGDDHRPPAPPRTARPPRPSSPPLIEVMDLTVGYAGRATPVLAHLHWRIHPGEHWVVVGPNGAGKTTLLYGLLGFLHPWGGEVRADGHRLDAVDPAWWREVVGYVPQHPYLVRGTVRENLRVARPAASEAEMWAALEKAEAAAFVAALPAGLDTAVGDRGLRLSAGERQRLALARLFLRDVPVVLLDEPARHLDPLTRGRVLRRLDQFLLHRSAVVVTHWPDERALGRQVLELGREPVVREIRR